MSLRKYFLLTDTDCQDPNPGDIFIGQGVEVAIRKAEDELGNIAVINKMNIFTYKQEVWDRMYEEADYLVVGGTPQLGMHVPDRFNDDFYKRLFKAREKGIRVVNLWAGICHQNLDMTKEEQANDIVTRHGDFIKRNFIVYDLIIVRDSLSELVLHKCGIKAKHLADSVFMHTIWWNRDDLRSIKKCSYDLVIMKNMGVNNDKLVERIKDSYKHFKEDRPLFILCHDIRDYMIFKDKLENVICVNNPDELMWFISRARKVLSFRVHGSIPAITMGLEVCNIRLDSRSNNYDDIVGVDSITWKDFIAGAEPVFTKCSVYPRCIKDMHTFINLFYDNVQVNYGSKSLVKASEYCGADYWKPKGNSTYNEPVMKLKETEEFAKLIISRCKSNDNVLELGCAGGYFTYLLNNSGITCYGQDISKFAIDAGKKEFGEVVANKLFVGSIDNLSNIPDNSIDVVYSQQVLEHIPTERVYLMLKELNRVCKKNANLYLYWVIGYDDSVARARSDKDETHWNLKSYQWWCKAFKKFGFTTMLDSGQYSTETYIEHKEISDVYDIQKIEEEKLYMFLQKD